MTRAYLTGPGEGPRQPSDLDRRYGKIGISAVAAALHCAGDATSIALLAAAEADAPTRKAIRLVNSKE